MHLRIKIGRNQLLVILIALVFLSLLYYTLTREKPIYSYLYKGRIWVRFRADLRKAEEIPVYPSEDIVRREILKPVTKNITIAFIPGERMENSYYALNAAQLATSLYYAFREEFGYVPSFQTKNISTYENLPGMIQNPMIVFVSPKASNETSIYLDRGHVIYLRAKSLKDIDLVTTKLCMIVLGIEL